MAAAQCTIVINPKGAPLKCVKGKKSIEKARADIEKMDGYKVQEVAKTRCPFCNPKPKQESEPGEVPEAVTLHAEVPERKAGYCHGCGKNSFKLMYVNRVMVRECNACGVWLNLEKMKPWGE